MKLAIYYGKPKPATAVGKNQCRLLGFAFEYKCWHYLPTDRPGKRAIQGLLRRGSIEVNDCGQYRFISPCDGLYAIVGDA